MRKLLINLALGTVTLVVLLTLVEGVMRWVDYDYRPLTIAARDDFRDTQSFREDHFEFDARLIWRPRRSYKIFNEQGFRGPLVGDEKAPDEVRIFTVGDSNTLGWKGEDGANWPGFVALLAGPRVQVVNAGVWGYSSLQGIGRLEEALRHAPDIVTISFGSNDAQPVRTTDADRVRSRAKGAWLKNRVGRHRLGRLLIGAVDRLRNVAAGDVTRARVSLNDYRDNLRRMVTLARRSNALPVLMTRPYVGVPEAYAAWKIAAPDYNAATVDVASELGVPLIDFYTLFKHREEFFDDESHFTVEGHRLAARWAWSDLRLLVEGLRR